MEAKDIRKQPVTNEIFSREDLDNAFKAGERRGYDQGVEDRLREIDALTARVKTAKQIGRKEVVEWFERARKQKVPKYQLEEWGVAFLKEVKK